MNYVTILVVQNEGSEHHWDDRSTLQFLSSHLYNTSLIKPRAMIIVVFDLEIPNPKLAVLYQSPILVSVKAVDLWSNTSAME